jgi:hypothetical protein
VPQPEGWADRQRSLLTSLADAIVWIWTGSCTVSHVSEVNYTNRARARSPVPGTYCTLCSYSVDYCTVRRTYLRWHKGFFTKHYFTYRTADQIVSPLSSPERKMSLVCLAIVGKDNEPLYQRDFSPYDECTEEEEDCFGFGSSLASDTISLRHEVCLPGNFIKSLDFSPHLTSVLSVHDARCVGLRGRVAYE